MRNLLNILIFSFLSSPLCVYSIEEGYVKESIKKLKSAILKDEPEKKALHEKELALAYYKDQDLDNAFKTYLIALEHAAEVKAEPMTIEEESLYNEALKIYLNPRSEAPHEIADALLDMYAGILKHHPEYYHLGYIVALAYANVGQFDRFFELFYPSYERLKNHFLAYKTKAILHIKLLERAKTPEEKEKERQTILSLLEEAKKRYDKDLSLYKMQINFSDDNDKSFIIERNVNELIANNKAVPRVDLPFYFDQLLAYGHVELAKKFLLKSREWYPYSRTLDAAQELINRKQSNVKE